jgi:hypothetical protein
MHFIPRQLTPTRHPGWFGDSRIAGFPRISSPFRTRLGSLLVPLFLIALISGCTKESGGVIDPSGIPLFVGSVAVSPDTIRMKSLPLSNGTLTVTVRAQARILRQAGSANIAGVNASVIASGATDPLLTLALHDDGSSPDSVAGDGVYSALIQFTIPRSASGVYILKVVATDIQGFVSNSVEAPLFMVRDSHAPVLSNLAAPDSVLLSVGETATIPLSIKATDPDGQADISQVYFLSLDSSNPTDKVLLYNDGSAPGSVPGDSIYSRTVQAPGTSARKTYRFAFQAVNNFGDTSATILHSITLY